MKNFTSTLILSVFSFWVTVAAQDTADTRYSSGCFSGLELWYNTTDASNATLSGINVIGWDDQYANDKNNNPIDAETNLENTSGDNSTYPAYITDDINGYDALLFGSDDYLLSPNVTGTDLRSAQEMTIFFVLKRNGGSMLMNHATGSARTQMRTDGFYWGTNPSSPATNRYLDYSSNEVGSDYEVRTVRVATSTGGTPNTEYYVYKNSNLLNSNLPGQVVTVATSGSSQIDDLIIGAYNSLDFTGYIAEIMVFNLDLGFFPVDINRIQSYLSLKYGISHDSNDPYIDHNNRDLFPYSTECDSEGPFSEYDSRVTGLFRDNVCYDMRHTKSTNNESGSILTGALTDNGGTFSNPNDFIYSRMAFLWGDNNETKTFLVDGNSTDVPTSSGWTRMERKWKVRESVRENPNPGQVSTNKIGDITYEFDLSSSDIPNNINYDEIFIIVDTDRDGSFEDETIGTGGVIEIAQADWDGTNKIGYFTRNFSDCEVFSIAIKTSALPVVWSDFKAIKLGNNKVQLDWSTAMEINNSHFVVEKSLDGSNWKSIGQVSGKGDFNDKSFYSFMDVEPKEGSNYYRIKQVDFDGKHSYSQTRSVLYQSDILVNSSVYPSVTSDFVNIEIPANTGNVEYSIVDLAGNVLKNDNFSASNHQVNLSDLNDGLYIVRLRINNTIKTHHIVVAR